MNLKDEFRNALKKGEDHEKLLDLVRCHHQKGVSPEQSYQTLQDIWEEFGFDDSDEESELRENLEFVMERIWYQGTHI